MSSGRRSSGRPAVPGLGGATAAETVLEGLDPEQREVATAVSGPVVVLAGAGTGKTRAITHRIAYAALTGQHDPRRTLAVTFTSRAAGEMRHRLAELGVEGVQARTFHSAALRQLRYFWPRVVGGAVPDVLPSKARVLGPVLRAAGFSDPGVARDVAAEIEWAKSSQVAAADYVSAAARARRDPPGSLTRENVAEAYAAYDDRKTGEGLIDFEDVLLLTVGMLDTRVDVAEEVRRAYTWFTVDEYQDVNPLQQRLLDLWLGDRDHLCVVGDASQTIYTFTGATSSYLLGFRARYPHATEVRLVRSYRSTPQVVSLANRVLSSAHGPEAALRLELRAQRADGPEPVVTAYDDDLAEAAGVASRVRRLLDDGVAAREIAVLYRINAQSEAFEEALGEAGIPYVLRGESAFFERGEVREAVTRIRGAARGGTGTGDLAADVRSVLSAMGWSSEPPSGTGAVRQRWENLLRVVSLSDDLARDNEDATLADLVDELDQRAATQAAPAADGVTLATVHAAKGLEWDAVLVAGLTQGTFPIQYADTAARLEEERRLFYVACTRARTHLQLSWARSRTGRRRDRSPFLVAAFGPDPSTPGEGGGVHRGAGTRTRSRRRTNDTCRVCGKALVTGREIALGRCTSCPASYDEQLVERLKAWRLDEAARQSVPAFVVLSDATVEGIASTLPASRSELLRVSGIGARKAELYGEALLALVRGEAVATSDEPA
ncbi:MAG TPA: ATP-dependent DNA helicase UvrD2 [Candidatus Nanopelagicales bacterium]|nr:ATP-dependent DNA helicase UvrD2 [Candidatus Nanopelagicales bacterium]